MPPVYEDEHAAKLRAQHASKPKPADQGWIEYLNSKAKPIVEAINAGAIQGSRSYGPLKEPIDTALDYLVSRSIGPNFTKTGFDIKEPMESVKARREKLTKEHPQAAEVGYRLHNLARDRMFPVAKAADPLSNMGYGSAVGAGSQALDEYDAIVNRGLPVPDNPFEISERIGAAGTGGAVGAMAFAGAGRKVPGVGNDMKSVPGKPFTAEELTAAANAAQKAHRAGDPMPDLAQILRLSGQPRLAGRAPAVESMYRKAEPLVINKGELDKHNVVGPGGEVTGNRLEGRLTTPMKDNRAEVAPPVLEQLRLRNEPGSFNATGDRLADRVRTADLALDRTARQVRVGQKVNDIIPPTLPPERELPQRITTAKRDIYEGDVERARTAPMAPGIVSAPRTRAQGEAAAGSPNSLPMWNRTLATLSPADARIAEQALASIGRARGSDPAKTGTGPAGIGNAWKDRNKAQAALDEHGEVQRSIGESFPYRPGEPPSLTITPPFAAKGFKAGLNIPSWGRGAASAGTDLSFRNPAAAAGQIGMKTNAEQWLAYLGAEAGSAALPRFWSAQRSMQDHDRRY